MSPGSAWAVLPVKRFEAAKSRLATILSGTERAALARSMFDHVMGVLGRSPSLSGIVVVTDSDAVAAAAHGRAIVLRDPPGSVALADPVDFALREVGERGAARAVVVVSDLPKITDADVARMLDVLADCDLVLAPDSGGSHTNALAVRLGLGFRTSFGHDESLRLHRDRASRAGLSVRLVESATLAFDVDTPEDYARLVSGR